MSKLKKINLEEFKIMAKGKYYYEHNSVEARNRKNFLANLMDRFPLSKVKIWKDKQFHQVVSKSKNSFVKSVKYDCSKDCAEDTSLEDFEQDRKYLCLVGDLYKIVLKVKGIMPISSNIGNLILETEAGDFLLVDIIDKRVLFLEIIKEIKKQ